MAQAKVSSSSIEALKMHVGAYDEAAQIESTEVQNE